MQPSFSMPVSRPTGRALLVASPSSRAAARQSLEGLGYICDEADEPYSAAMQLLQEGSAHTAVVFSLGSLYKEELALIGTIKRRRPQVEVWLTHTDGRQSALAEAMRLGADGLLAEDGLHRIGLAPSPSTTPAAWSTYVPSHHRHDPPAMTEATSHPDDSEFAPDEPVLTADELRMLLQDHPATPPGA
jgi:hypothetical protein